MATGVAAWELYGGDTFPEFRPAFGQDGLVTNEWAFRNPHRPQAHESSDWVTTSGSLFAVSGLGWTGRPDAGETGSDSRTADDSAVFRLVSRRRDFGSVAVSLKVRLLPPIVTARTPALDWDGAHVWLRYHSPQELYALSFRRRDGAVVIKRKVPADDAAAVEGGDYTTIAEGRCAITYGDWHHVEAQAVNTFSGVRLRLAINGKEVLRTVDRTPGPLAKPGGVGLRADNSELWFGDFRAHAA
ncbi:hypothetical protein [Streptomyces mangrovisoli]|uniref:hypothetical protein n=1 Tax=Streptomyces mangrovisoli TaxID=1428628 RepID=UPI001F0B0D09|nr:hypothetical protein [Streptomyces mangrovisoli]